MPFVVHPHMPYCGSPTIRTESIVVTYCGCICSPTLVRIEVRRLRGTIFRVVLSTIMVYSMIYHQ